jgi:hypothetical protein
MFMALFALGSGCSSAGNSESRLDRGSARRDAGADAAKEEGEWEDVEDDDAGLDASAGDASDRDTGADAGADASATDANVSDTGADAADHIDAGGGVRSSFDSNDEGWTITGDARATGAKPEFGNPDAGTTGLISAKDDVTGGIWYFTAPAKYLGDQSQAFGRTLSFDLKVTPISNPFDAPDVVLEAGQLSFNYDLPRDPGTDWTHYEVPLDGSGWKAGEAADAGMVSAQEFRALLAHLTALRIRGEYHSGPDTGSLANVHFGE